MCILWFQSLWKIVSKNETALVRVSDRSPASPTTFRRSQNETPSRIKGFNYTVYSLELWNLSNVIELRNKPDTPKVAYTLRDSTADQPAVHFRVPLSTPFWYFQCFLRTLLLIFLKSCTLLLSKSIYLIYTFCILTDFNKGRLFFLPFLIYENGSLN